MQNTMVVVSWKQMAWKKMKNESVGENLKGGNEKGEFLDKKNRCSLGG